MFNSHQKSGVWKVIVCRDAAFFQSSSKLFIDCLGNIAPVYEIKIMKSLIGIWVLNLINVVYFMSICKWAQHRKRDKLEFAILLTKQNVYKIAKHIMKHCTGKI